MKAGARSLSRDVAGRVKSTMGGGNKRADVWETATTEVPGDEPPECQWCPICRAARRYRDSGGTGAGLGSQLPRVGDTLAGFAQDAFSLFEATIRAQQRPATATRPAEPDDASADSQDKGQSNFRRGEQIPHPVTSAHQAASAFLEGPGQIHSQVSQSRRQSE